MIYQLWYNLFKHYISKILKVCTISIFNIFSRNFQCLNYHNEQAEGIFRNIYMAYVFGDNLYGRKQKGFLESLETVRRRVLSITEEGGY